MVSGIDLIFTLSLQQVQGEVHISIHTCTNNYLRCTECEVHDRVSKHVIRCTKKHVPRFLIFEALRMHISLKCIHLYSLYIAKTCENNGQSYCHVISLKITNEKYQTLCVLNQIKDPNIKRRYPSDCHIYYMLANY